MKRIFAIVSSLFIAVGSSVSFSSDGSDRLPHCVSEVRDIEIIKNKIKLNSKNDNKYDGYKEAFASDSDAELMARLIYAETKATKCEKLNSSIVPVITKVISNRVKTKKGDVKAVVFERDQFASSLNIYSESNYKDFLCPNDSKLWAMALNEASEALADKATPTATVNYFLYKHSARWTKEPWSLDEDTSLVKGSVRDCIKAFKNPGYK
ncbi:MAG: cell wall hydrolase [Pseudobdellovibrio sp.]|nr:cell wall hydrolase [Pseudobdellovibrio sp.]